MLTTYWTTLRLVYGLLGELRSQFHWIMVFSLANGLLEVTGVLSIYPFLMMASNPEQALRISLMQRLYDGLGFGSPAAFVAALGVLFLVLYLLANLGNAGGEWLRYTFSTRLSCRLSRQILSGYLRSPYGFLLSRNTAELLHQSVAEAGYAGGLANRLVETMIRASVATAVSLGLLALEPLATLATVLAIVLVYNQVYRFHRDRAAALGEERLRLTLQASWTAGLALTCLKEARAFTAREQFLGRFQEPSERLVAVAGRLRALTVFPRYATETLAIMTIVGLLIYLVLTGRGPVAVPAAGVFVLATWRLVPCLQDIYGNLIEIRAELPVLERMARELAGGVPVLPDGEPGVLTLGRAVRVQDVSFSYPGRSRPVLESVSLVLPHRTSLALVGRTGAGKTTLADLLCGFHRPDLGTITIDDRSLDESCTLAWQRNLGYVPQQVCLLDDTIAHNVALGVPPEVVDREAVRRACRLAQIDGFIEKDLPDQYDTMLGERGLNLSGGQRQRLGIARALYGDPDLLVLDEATSSLDNLTECSVMETLAGLSDRKTLLVIAHRLSTVKLCDAICVLQEGRVVSQGSFEHLMRECPVFQELVRSELGKRGSAQREQLGHPPRRYPAQVSPPA